MADPQLLARAGSPQSLADLALLPSMDLGQPQDEHAWDLTGPDGSRALVRHHPRLVTGSMPALRSAAVAGMGVVQLPRMMVGEQFARGELVQVLPGWAPRREVIHAVFASRRGLLPGVRALIDYLANRFELLAED